MDDTQRLTACFKTVFPDLSEGSIVNATQDTVMAWDSVATITLVQVIEDDFGVRFDLERMGDFTSFAAIQNYLKECSAA